ncbi:MULTISPECIES: dTDP-4-dehydrorhamnose reductase [Pseudomonas]|uniref:dTDP-4-dehydrorhamnose reductase n=1 Tax=Pseudomonas TaxID=286 RepID=UPI0007B3A16B|nr:MULTISPECIES: dTDP-4-dehydrorhamnose reductase [Pseudomonas]AZC47936.1 dTDP-4-dehydrorhamnose reductase [Pseudomonas chlororaphis subsp. piscium]AZC54517.1 dTDP-4-dehydrorhamnose reductase [Pseudomonas chlororaphis subsp. piscium]AZC60839.1 dTDP-4-dehydrorhamnose reductase [Pseudomonas chlororaphis subsp. piscium]AZC67015.1 dTDP-4-dehydrorhamnose reductase [Pseudomonas chlororaphis subsp. piscium]AZC73253.1 dTDP-4-dehydrorhamnose reductase [Pseudomonas chlororaphis subsp. piscium]
MSGRLKILISGQHGQVSQALQQYLGNQHELIVPGRGLLDLSNPDAIRQQVRSLRPQLIINAAAHTAVDQAESEPELAFAINASAPGVFAEEARELGIPLIHYSTDYVFDGSKQAPYTEDDEPNPLSVYGQSKLAGEQAIGTASGEHLILRTSWVYSNTGKNFLLTMQRLLQEKPHLRVVADQIGAPTWASTIAASTAALIERWQAGKPGAWGTYHLTAAGETSWFGFAQAIGEHLLAQGKACATLEAIPSSAYPTPAPRPLNSRLDCSRLAREWGVVQPQWRSALHECLAGQA